MRELTSDEMELVAGGLTSSTGSLGSDVERFFTDAANGASKSTLISDGKAVRSDLQGRAAVPIALGFIAAALLQNRVNLGRFKILLQTV